MRSSICLAACLACLAAAPVAATEPAGTIQASFDGEAREWRTVADGVGDATATVSAQAGFTGVTIQGHPLDGPMMENLLSIVVGYLGPAEAGADPFEVTVALYPAGLSGGFWTSEEVEPAPEVIFTRLDAPGGRAEGSFAGTLCFKASMFAAPDRDDCRRIEGNFDTALYPSD